MEPTDYDAHPCPDCPHCGDYLDEDHHCDADEPRVCGGCACSGEGYADGAACRTCGGSGEIAPELSDEERDRLDAIAEDAAEARADRRREEGW